MSKDKDDWGLGGLGELFGFDTWPGGFSFWSDARSRGGSKRRRKQMFESGEVKFVILRLLKEGPRHGYDIIKELEDRFAGCYTPSAGTVYPTLQLLEDQGYVRAEVADGKKVYHITEEGERFLEQNSDLLDDIFERVKETVRGIAGGRMGDIHGAYRRLTSATYKRAWRYGPNHPALERVAEILNKAADDIEQAWSEA
ncbi:MAG: PadR family transcriptional regulator [Gemmatimonadales bacterium]